MGFGRNNVFMKYFVYNGPQSDLIKCY